MVVKFILTVSSWNFLLKITVSFATFLILFFVQNSMFFIKTMMMIYISIYNTHLIWKKKKQRKRKLIRFLSLYIKHIFKYSIKQIQNQKYDEKPSLSTSNNNNNNIYIFSRIVYPILYWSCILYSVYWKLSN